MSSSPATTSVGAVIRPNCSTVIAGCVDAEIAGCSFSGGRLAATGGRSIGREDEVDVGKPPPA
jgi:hypothetical protein